MPIRRLLAFFALVLVCGVYAKQQKIVIATLEYPPYIYSENDQVKGPLVDKVRAIFAQLGGRYDHQSISDRPGTLDGQQWRS